MEDGRLGDPHCGSRSTLGKGKSRVLLQAVPLGLKRA